MVFLILFPISLSNSYLDLGVYYALIIKKCKGTKNTIFSFLYWGSSETGIIVIILHVCVTISVCLGF